MIEQVHPAHKQTETAMRAAVSRYRTLFNEMDEGYCIIEMIFDETGRPIDWRFVEVNPAFAKHHGLTDVVGKTIRQTTPDIEPKWFERYGQVALTGRPLRFEEYSKTLNRWFDLYAFRVEEPEQRRVAVLFTNITARKETEAALRESEGKYRELFESIDQGFCTIEVRFDAHDRPVDYRFLMANPAFERQTGIANAAGRWMREIAPLHEEHWFQVYGRIALTGEPQRFENVAAQLNRVYEVFAWRVDEPTQRRVAILFNDITARKETEAALRENEERLQQALQVSRSYTFEWMPATDAVLRSASCATVLGLKGDEIRQETGQRHFQRVHPDDRNRFTGILYALTPASPSYRTEYRFLPGDGRVVMLEEIGRGSFDAGGKLNRLVGVVTDITQRKKIEEELRESEERFRSVLRGGKVIIAHCDADLRYQWVHNPRPDFDAAAILGKRDTELAQNEGVQQLEALKGAVVRRGLPLHQEISFPLSDGVYIYDIQATPVTGAAGEVTGVKTLAVDITARKQAEEALRNLNAGLDHQVAERTAEVQHQAEQLRMLASELIRAEERERRRMASILHDDLQQTLVAAKMRLVAIEAGATSDQVRAPARAVQKLVAEAISTSRSLTADLTPPVLYDVGLVAALGWLAARMKEKHGLHVQVLAGEENEPDDQELRVFLFQAVRELLFNVVKHAGVSEAQVSLSRSEGRMSVRVEDAGRGFDAAGMRGNQARGGFGMFSLRERVRLMGGRLEIDSAPGKGTRVTLELREPAAVAIDAPASSGPGPESAPPPKRSGGPIRVLLADDHKILREGLASLLQQEGDIEVVGQANDGLEAVDLAAKLHPDVVLMDISMPRLDGIGATRAITAQLPSVKVIGLSMHESSDIAEKMKAAGATAYLHKDDAGDQLVAAIRKHMLQPDPSTT